MASLLHPQYRPDIDGLRAIAVLSVIAFHYFPWLVPGGFIGVDIFFVISGYLITTIIWGSYQRDEFSLRTFYARRARRIFPALIVVLAATLVLGWYLLLPNEWEQLGLHLVGGAGFFSNFLLWSEAGYFDADSNSKLLLHLWSLSIEEQFYIFWPLVIGLAWWRKWKILPVLGGIAIVSFLVNLFLVSGHREAAFYAPWSRGWELAAGGVLSCIRLETITPLTRLGSSIRAFVESSFGLLFIAAGLFVIDADDAFPGWWAMLPVLGTMLCISAGSDGWVNRWILGNRLLVWIGLISYPLYLWHWPVLVFVQLFDATTPFLRIILIAISFLLAWLTYGLVEKNIRHSRGRFIVPGLSLLLITIGVMGLLVTTGHLKSRIDTSSPYLGMVLKAKTDWDNAYSDRFVYTLGAGSKQKVLLIGDSMMQQYAPRLHELVETGKADDVTFHFVTRSGCLMLPNITYDNRHPACTEMRDTAIQEANSTNFDTIVLGGAWNGYFVLNNWKYHHTQGDIESLIEHNSEGMEAALKEIGLLIKSWVGQGKTVYLLLDNPIGSDFDPRKLIQGSRLEGKMSATQDASTVRYPPDQKHLHTRLIEIAASNGAKVIDPVSTLCQVDVCLRSLSDGSPIYKDDWHLRASYVRENARWMDELVDGERD
jgi:peptidoglycan/LPS O-acetylase OafA/YrhL